MSLPSEAWQRSLAEVHLHTRLDEVDRTGTGRRQVRPAAHSGEPVKDRVRVVPHDL